MWGVYNLAKIERSLHNPVPVAESTAGWTPMVSPRYKTRLFHGPWCDPVRVHIRICICAVGCRTLAGDGLTEYIQSDANEETFGRKRKFEIKNETDDQGQSSLKSVGILTLLRCIFAPNLEILTSIGVTYHADKLKIGQILILSSIWPRRSRTIAPKNQ